MVNHPVFHHHLGEYFWNLNSNRQVLTNPSFNIRGIAPSCFKKRRVLQFWKILMVRGKRNHQYVSSLYFARRTLPETNTSHISPEAWKGLLLTKGSSSNHRFSRGEHAISFIDDTYFCLQYTGDIIEILGFQNPVSYLNEDFFSYFTTEAFRGTLTYLHLKF